VEGLAHKTSLTPQRFCIEVPESQLFVAGNYFAYFYDFSMDFAE
jgi:hypothetical protein